MPGAACGLYEFNGGLYAVNSPGMSGMYVGSFLHIPLAQPEPAPANEPAAGTITADHMVKLAAVLLQPGSVADLYNKV